MKLIWISLLALIYVMALVIIAIPFFIKEVFIDLTGIGK
jgi:hypothetical protein